MAPADLLLLLAAGLLLAVAAATDLRTRLIPNWLTLPAIFAGTLAISARCMYGYPLLLALAGSTASLFISGLPWLIEGWGGGDAKACLAVLLLAGPAFPGLYFSMAFAGCLALLLIALHVLQPPPGEDNVEKRPLAPWLFAAYLLSAWACAACFGGLA